MHEQLTFLKGEDCLAEDKLVGFATGQIETGMTIISSRILVLLQRRKEHVIPLGPYTLSGQARKAMAAHRGMIIAHYTAACKCCIVQVFELDLSTFSVLRSEDLTQSPSEADSPKDGGVNQCA